YHRFAQEQADMFIKSIRSGDMNVINQVDQHWKKQAEENGQRLVLIVKMIILCGQLRIALCGHRDEGIIDIDTALSGRESNFRALLAFRVDSGDKAFVERWTNTRKKSTYVSKETQNELIKICGEQILEVIVSDVKKAKYFSISGDETTDSFDKEQFCLCIWYVSEDFMLKEEFIGFGAEDLCARSIVSEILERLQKLDLCVADCMGQGYDGALALAGHISGVQALFRQHAPMAVYVHCASHTLNLVLNHGYRAQAMALSIAAARSFFVQVSPRSRQTSRYSMVCTSPHSHPHLIMLVFDLPVCMRRRFRHRHVDQSVSAPPGRSSWGSRSISVSPTACSLSFHNLSRALPAVISKGATLVIKLFCDVVQCQPVTMDEMILQLATCSESLLTIFRRLLMECMVLRSIPVHVHEHRCNALMNSSFIVSFAKDDVEWQGTYYAVFNQAECYAEIVGIKLMKPRCSSHQMHRSTYTAVADISDSCHEVLYQELKLYADLRASQKITSTSVLDILREMPSRIENVHRLVQIAATLPVTTYSAERSFSGMKILKSCLRSTMIDDRLNGFAHMYIHKEIPVSVENVITEFALARKQKTDCF
uniref:HAT C-terminal dimerisation domain-containing protein n=1 Tax=Latimeria chalumnae TaxID=7897 RepID=H3A636_LATCH